MCEVKMVYLKFLSLKKFNQAIRFLKSNDVKFSIVEVHHVIVLRDKSILNKIDFDTKLEV
jgi:hypothetical protein